MKKRNRRPNHFLKAWLNSLKKLWRSLVKALRSFFAEDVDRDINSRSRRSPVSLQSESIETPPIIIPRPAPFLLGLDDIPNLNSLTTKALIDQIEWNAESQEILTAKEEDLNLLEDLLVNFPES